MSHITWRGAIAREWPDGTTFKFHPGVNDWNGYRGLRCAAFPGFDPVGAEACVHDVLEHFPFDKPGPAEEWMAQGAFVLLRCEGGWFDSPVTGGRDWAGFHDRVDGALELLFKTQLDHRAFTPHGPDEPEDWGLHNRVASDWMYAIARRALGHGIPAAVKWWARRAGPIGEWSRGAHADVFLRMGLQHARAWMIRGYERARFRFRDHLDQARAEFRAATGALQHVQDRECDECEVRVHTAGGLRLQVTCACHPVQEETK